MTHAQDSEKYLYFSVGLLRGSLALNALWQDALKYHMVDQPGQLIAMRLTEYYEALFRERERAMADVQASSISLAPPPSMPPPLTNEAPRETLLTPKITSPGHGQNRVTRILNHPGTEAISQTGNMVEHPSQAPPLPSDGIQRSHANGEVERSEDDLDQPQSISETSSQSPLAVEQQNTEVFASSAGAEQNAEAAADYWTML